MAKPNEGVSQGDDGASLPPPQPGLESLRSISSNKVLKSGPLFLSSKGIGWTSWKKRWFILTQTSLVFFRSDPNAVPQKGSEVNITLGGIDLNNTGSVVVKAEKKLLTVAFSDGCDGRAFTLKAETTEDLFEWKTALESALAEAPPVTAQNGILGNDQIDNIPLDQLKDREPMKSTVIGRPILLALEDVDGSPSFLEKALQFIEEHGVKVEGILRQAADVEQVERRIREYEQGKTEFSAGEDAHVIGDCIKHVLRELPSPPVPASCCKALVEACRTERGGRVSAMRASINDTFPEPNRRLLQRILLMMQAIASHKAENRMGSSAVAACMAPLLLRSLMSGECEIENDFDVGSDGSAQLLQAAAAANHAQAIVITLLEEYDSIFGVGSVTPDIYTDSEESGSESEEATDYDDDDDDYEDEDEEEEDDEDIDEDDYIESMLVSDAEDYDEFISGTSSETEDSGDYNINDNKDHGHSSSVSKSSGVSKDPKVEKTLSSNSLEASPGSLTSAAKTASAEGSNKPAEISTGVFTDQNKEHGSSSLGTSTSTKKSSNIASDSGHGSQCRNLLGRRAAGSKNLSESADSRPEDEGDEIDRLENMKAELQNQIAKEVKGNAKLQSELEMRKKALCKRRLALEQDVVILQELLQKEKNSRATLEAGLKIPPVPLPNLPGVDEKTKAELEELAQAEAELTNLEQKVDELRAWLNPQSEQKLNNKPATEVTAVSQLEKLRSMGDENERKPDTTSPNKPGKRSGKRSEGKNSTASALTRLTTRLNFLKERRTQMANELQSLDKSQELALSVQSSEKGEGSEQQQSTSSPGKGSEQQKSPKKGTEFHISLPTPGKGSEFHISLPTPGKGSEFRISLPSPGGKPRRSEKAKGFPDKGSGKEGQPLKNPDKLKKSDSHPPNRADNKNQHPLERGKSEGSQHFKEDKGR